MTRRIVGSVLALTFLGASPALAQLPGIEISPYIGGYIPMTDQVDQPDLTNSQKEAFAFGARVGVQLPGPLGVEGSFLYALSDLEIDDAAAAEPEEVDAAVWAASGKLVYEFGLPASPVSFNANGGLAIIGRTGDAYDEADETTDVGGVIGVGVRVGLPGLWSIRFDVEDYLYSFQGEGEPGEEIDSQFQSDVVLSAGVVWTLGL